MHITTKATGYAVSTFHPEIILMETQILDFSMLAQTKTLAVSIERLPLLNDSILSFELPLYMGMSSGNVNVTSERFE